MKKNGLQGFRRVRQWWGKGQPAYHHPLFWLGITFFIGAIFMGPPRHDWLWPFLPDFLALACLGWLGLKKVDWNS